MKWEAILEIRQGVYPADAVVLTYGPWHPYGAVHGPL